MFQKPTPFPARKVRTWRPERLRRRHSGAARPYAYRVPPGAPVDRNAAGQEGVDDLLGDIASHLSTGRTERLGRYWTPVPSDGSKATASGGLGRPVAENEGHHGDTKTGGGAEIPV